jgi:hypothetical protein
METAQLFARALISTAVIASYSGHAAAAVGTQFLSINPLSLTPMFASSADHSRVDARSFNADNSGATVCRSTGLSFPQGATLKRLFVYVSSDAAGDVTVVVTRTDLTIGQEFAVVSQQVRTDTGNYTYASYATDARYSRVNNGRYSFGLFACLKTGSEFYGAIIEYLPR